MSDREAQKEDFFKELETLRPDLLYPEGWSKQDVAKAAELVRPAAVKKNMLLSIPMLCKGNKCQFAVHCPLMQQGLAPADGKTPCPIEVSFLMQLFNDYVAELEVDVTSMVEVSMIRDLVDQEIQHIRKAWALSEEHFITENVVGVDSNGHVVTKQELHPAVEYEDKILKRKERLRNALLATRESKAKAGMGAGDSSQVISGILHEVRRVKLEEEKRRKKELGLDSYDDYTAEVVDVEVES